MIVQNNRSGLIIVPSLGAQGEELGQIRLLPGNNEVSGEVWQKSRAVVANHIESGVIKELYTEVKKLEDASGKKATKVTSKDFKDLSLIEAKKVVEQTFNVETLRQWQDLGVDGTFTMIEKQIKKVMDHGNEKAKGKAE